MNDFLLQAKGVAGLIQQSFIADSENESDIEKRALETFFSVCKEKGLILGLGIMQISCNGNSVMGTYFNHFGKECITYLRQVDYNILSIISTGNVVIGSNFDNSMNLEDFVDLQDILRFCNNGKVIYYNQSKFGLPLYDALMTIHTEGELVPVVQALDVF